MEITSVRETRSRDEIEEAICAFSSADWIRLRLCAKKFVFARPWLSPEDLLQEAFCRALEEKKRECPVNVEVVYFLVEAMRSIASGEQEKVGNRPIIESVSLDHCNGEVMEERRDSDEMTELVKARVMPIFDDDPLAIEIIDGLMEGLEASEIREITDLDKTSYDSKRRLIRRRVDKHYPNGWEEL